jgi:alpha-1,3-glucosyltransferase
MVKEHLAKKYNIPTTIPAQKTRDAVIAAKKAANVAKLNSTINTMPPNMQNGSNAAASPVNGQGPPHSRPPPLGQGQTAFVNYSANPQPPFRGEQARPHLPPFNEPHRPPQMYPPPPNGSQPPFRPMMHPHPPPQSLPQHLLQLSQQMGPPGVGVSLPFQPSFMHYHALAPGNNTLPPQQQQPQQQQHPLQHQQISIPKPFEPVKYPIEDLRIKQPRVSVQRPPLKFLCDDVPEGAKPPEEKTGILMKSVGPLLCAWETLNVHDGIYSLDSFTFDDFLDAMRFSSEEVECELLTEVHCAVLKQIVSESGRLQTPLPKPDEPGDSDNEASSKATTPEPEPEPEPPVRTTRSSLRKSEASSMLKQRTPTPEPPKQTHKAAEFLTEFNWIEQCKIRNFRDGGWQAILVGLVHQLSFSPVRKEACEEILAALVPADEEPSVETIAFNYVHMDVNLRVAALDMALQLTVTTEHFREQLTQASLEMTRLRKDKIEHQKRRKEL